MHGIECTCAEFGSPGKVNVRVRVTAMARGRVRHLRGTGQVCGSRHRTLEAATEQALALHSRWSFRFRVRSLVFDLGRCYAGLSRVRVRVRVMVRWGYFPTYHSVAYTTTVVICDSYCKGWLRSREGTVMVRLRVRVRAKVRTRVRAGVMV